MQDLARTIFKELQEKLIIRSYKYTEIYNLPCVDFSYFDGMKSWSHSVSLAYDETNIYLFSCRMMKKDELKENIFREYGSSEAMYKIKIKNTSEAIDFLRKHDNFKYKF